MPKTALKKFQVVEPFIISLFIVFLLILASFNLYFSSNKTAKVLSVQDSPIDEKDYWQAVVDKNPTYRDGFIELARVEAEMGDLQSSEKALEVAKKIDPNSLNLLKTEIELLSSK